MAQERTFEIREEYITLGQLLKAADVASGAEAREMITKGLLFVNGKRDDRRGKKLRHDDVVSLPNGHKIRIVAPPAQ